MKNFSISTSLQLGLLLMVAMLAAGFGSGWVAYQLGIASLKGVSQPDINPAKKFTNDRTSYGRNQTFIPVKEEEVIKRVRVYMQQQKNKTQSKDETKG
ncbi:MAG: hypothetical protein EWV55_22960 [Microcystis viridis Mv_BB_P_19951000_S69]|uniref:Uncharacterized protein n=1 Tax=Microcystis viridis Mv_BB_P_19951000_S68D TaxID=2486270 RepID=A0A552I4X0_MICVR|nr:MAG: hypothetical protein EWV55_22960 [Microcystis viridis Mv_BB_P_19951000_S69]TRU78522.1 MAG: hypothetical protein EWV77_04075 [Microcystis viridis Mv_BB_P_19951000_S68D]TRU78830.1 MAG: hypothetical protein EWV47_01160 [Microcystis viridis Mv_BB_P_19951000_S68]TRU86040.1 MAG: hypothetical protein EWV46_11160 [Microcystis viridis Mv_BB_P_19951000_S69D]